MAQLYKYCRLKIELIIWRRRIRRLLRPLVMDRYLVGFYLMLLRTQRDLLKDGDSIQMAESKIASASFAALWLELDLLPANDKDPTPE